MKLLITSNLAECLGGAEKALLTFLAGVDRDRIEPKVVLLRTGPMERQIADLGVEVRALSRARVREVHRTAANLLRLRAIMREQCPDLILNWLTGAQLHGGTAALLAGMASRNAWWQHDFPSGRDDRLAPILPGRHIAACSRAVADAQQRVWPHRRPTVIWPGVHAPTLLGVEDIAARKRELSIPAYRPVVGILGRLLPWKGQREFLGAIARLRAGGRDIHGLVVGGPPDGREGYECELRSLRRRAGLEGAVTFTGQRRDGPAHLQLMDVCINASTREPFGMVVVEALAAGVPVVTVDAGGAREIVEGERTGVLCSTNRPEDLASAAARLLDDSALCVRLARAGRERYEAQFTAERMVRDIQKWVVQATGMSVGT